MSVAKLKEEGDEALCKKDYNAAIEFYNMVHYCTMLAPDACFCSPTIVISFDLYPLQWLTSLSDVFFWMLVQTIFFNFLRNASKRGREHLQFIYKERIDPVYEENHTKRLFKENHAKS
jgi:hypothetical protein